jgi:hypothetical protein
LPAIGLLVNDRLIGIALIAPPQRRLGITDSWAWRLRMVLSTVSLHPSLPGVSRCGDGLRAVRLGAFAAIAGDSSAIPGQTLRRTTAASGAQLVRGG